MIQVTDTWGRVMLINTRFIVSVIDEGKMGTMIRTTNGDFLVREKYSNIKNLLSSSP